MKTELFTSYASREKQLAEIDRQITELEEKLKTPARTVEDIVRHIQLIKERQKLTDLRTPCCI